MKLFEFFSCKEVIDPNVLFDDVLGKDVGDANR